MIKVTADFLIDRRKRQWNNHYDIKKDEKFRIAVARELTINENLRNEIIDKPEKLIELVFVVVDKNKKAVPFFLNDVQHSFIDTLNKAIEDYNNHLITNISLLVLKGRQQGFTTLISAYQLAREITRHNCEGLTLADKTSNSEAIFQNKAKYFYNNLPDVLKPTEKFNSKRQLLFDKLNSSWAVDTATREVGRSRTINFFTAQNVHFGRMELQLFKHLWARHSLKIQLRFMRLRQMVSTTTGLCGSQENILTAFMSGGLLLNTD